MATKRMSPAQRGKARRIKPDITFDPENAVESYKIMLSHPDSPYQKMTPDAQGRFRKGIERIIAKRQDIA